MVDVKIIASYICGRYQEDFGQQISEMKLHKLLYFAQRECMIQLGEPLFSAQFEAWKFGPVLVDIRFLYKHDLLHEKMDAEDSRRYASVFDMVFRQYAPKDAWSLSSITHGEYSWRKARKGYARDAECCVRMKIEDIAKDAERIKIRRFVFERLKRLEA